MFTFTYAIYRKRRQRQRKNPSPLYQCILACKRNPTAIQGIENRKGKFILATNRRDDLTAERIVELYTGRNKNIEGCFKQLKDSTFRLHEVFLKRVDRIEALMAIMALSLLFNNLGQHRLPTSLKERGATLPNQKGQPIHNPTLKWAFQCMDKVIKLSTTIGNRIHDIFVGLQATQKQIIECFGPHAKTIYGFP